MYKLALDSCEKYRETFNKKNESGAWLYGLFEGEVQAYQTVPYDGLELCSQRAGRFPPLLVHAH